MEPSARSLSRASEDDSDEPIFLVDEVSRIYSVDRRTIHALENVNISVWRGEMVLVEGKSGSGKTTLLNLLGGLDTVSSGTIRYKGQDMAMLRERERTQWRREHIGFVFQAFALLPGLTAFENVDLAGRLAGLAPKESSLQATINLKAVGIAARADHRISELSGGEQQRVAIARGLIGSPEIVLADEPTGELDHAMSRKVLDVLRGLVDDQGLTVCLTSHDPAVRGYAHRTYTLDDGRLVNEQKHENTVHSGTLKVDQIP